MIDSDIRSEGRSSPLPYFVYTGWIVAILLFVTLLVRLQLGDLGWSFTKQLLAVGLTSLIFVINALRWANSETLARWRDNRRARAAAKGRTSPDLATLRVGIEVGTPGKRLFGVEGHPVQAVRSAGAFLADLRARFTFGYGPEGGGGPRSLESKSLRDMVVLAGGAVRYLGRYAGLVGLLVYVLAALCLLLIGHRTFVIVFALLQVAVLQVVLPTSPHISRWWLAVASVVSWALASGMTYTHLGDWLLNGSPSTGLAMAAFVLSFGLVAVELSRPAGTISDIGVTRIAFGIGLVAFSAYAFRTDNFLADWVPIHRAYFADVAQLVKDGHWLLWDVPSLYGFLSILTLAIVPASNGWQALFEVTGVFLVAQACMTFVILRWGRSGWMNAGFAVLLPVSTLLGDNIARYAMSPRLYPQGGMRFIWIVSLIFVAFLMYVWRSDVRRVVALRWTGFAVWLIAVLWSFENAVWATAVWLPFVFLDAVIDPALELSRASIIRRVVVRAWPFVALPALAIAVIDVVYSIRFGAQPDWRAFVEFVGLFASGGVRAVFFVQYLGPAWIIILLLGAAGTTIVAAIHERRWNLLPLLAATWLAVWITASYYAVEPLDMYVVLLFAVLIPAAAIVIFVSRELEQSVPALFARISLIPIAVISIAFAVGEPSRLAAMQLPFTHGWNFDVTQSFVPISGELERLLRRANVSPSDKVLFPNGDFWTEIDQGLIMPFTRSSDGRIVMYHSWLPVSPVGPEMLLNGMPASRRSVYVERFLDQESTAGWYVTYREPARCERLSTRLSTVRAYSSTNFSIALCAIEATFSISGTGTSTGVGVPRTP